MKSPCSVSYVGPLKSNEDQKCFTAVFAISDTELLTAPIQRGQSTPEIERRTLQKYLYLLLTYSKLGGMGRLPQEFVASVKATERAAEAARVCKRYQEPRMDLSSCTTGTAFIAYTRASQCNTRGM